MTFNFPIIQQHVGLWAHSHAQQVNTYKRRGDYINRNNIVGENEDHNEYYYEQFHTYVNAMHTRQTPKPYIYVQLNPEQGDCLVRNNTGFGRTTV